MTFKPKIWYPVAVVLSGLNLVGVGFAMQPGEPWHATIHAGLALAFGLWAQRLRSGSGTGDVPARLEALEGDMSNRLELIEGDMSSLGRELTELQERLDFAERLLAQGSEVRRMGPDR